MTCSVTSEEKNHTSIDTLENWRKYDIRHGTRHVILRRYLRRKCTCQLTFNFVFENITWHFGFEVERQIKFLKHTHQLWGPKVELWSIVLISSGWTWMHVKCASESTIEVSLIAMIVMLYCWWVWRETRGCDDQLGFSLTPKILCYHGGILDYLQSWITL